MKTPTSSHHIPEPTQKVSALDDSHSRWETEDLHLKQTWERYDQEVAQQIVHYALQHKDLTLHNLYHSLSMTRATCELEKNKKGEFSANGSHGEAILDQLPINMFGYFLYGGSHESNVCGFGQAPMNLFNERTGKIWYEKVFSCNRGLSHSTNIKGSIDLTHPTGSVLKRLEPTFQKLIKTENFFEFQQLAARMMYDLSNYPPTTRGSAAINTWILNNIAKEKFDVNGSLRPMLYDWTAFLEIPDSYSGFYVISSTVKYLAFIPDLYNEDKEFYDSIPALMIEDPNKEGILQRREAAWNRIRTNIQTFLIKPESNALSFKQAEALKSMVQGNIEFRTLSAKMIGFIDALISQQDALTSEGLDQILQEADLSKENLETILNLDDTISTQYLNAYGNDKEEAMLYKQWADLEVLRQLPYSKIQMLKSICYINVNRITPNNMLLTKILSNPETINHERLMIMLNSEPSLLNFENNIYYVGANVKWVPKKMNASMPLLFRISFSTFEDFSKLSPEILELFAYNNTTPLAINLQNAICSGGVNIQDLENLTLEEITQISSEEATELYLGEMFIRAPDVLATYALKDDSIDKRLKKSREKWLDNLAKSSMNVLPIIPVYLREDSSFMYEVIKLNVMALQYLSSDMLIKLIPELPNIIDKSEKFALAQKVLGESQRHIVFEAVSVKKWDFIHTVEDLQNVLQFLNEDQRNLVFAAMSAREWSFIHTAQDMQNVLQFLNEDQRNLVFAAMSAREWSFIHTAQDMQNVLRFLNEDQRNLVFAAMSARGWSFIHTAQDMQNVLRFLNEDQRNLVFAAMSARGWGFIHTAQDMQNVLQFLNEDQRNLVFAAMSARGWDFVHTATDMYQLLRFFNEKQRLHIISKFTGANLAEMIRVALIRLAVECNDKTKIDNLNNISLPSVKRQLTLPVATTNFTDLL